MRSTLGVKLLLLVLVVLVANVSARIGTSWTEDVGPRRLRSIDALTSDVFEELNRLHMTGAAGALQIPHVARRIHKIVVEGSADEGEDFDDRARGRALKALNDGSDRLLEGISDQQKEMARRVLESGDSRELVTLEGASTVLGIAAFTALVAFFVVSAVTFLINPEGVKDIDIFKSNTDPFKATPGETFKNVIPCRNVPLQMTPNPGEDSPPLFSYLSITPGFIGNLLFFDQGVDGAVATVTLFAGLLNIIDVLSNETNIPDRTDTGTCLAVDDTDKCKVTAECCEVDGFVDCNTDTNQCEKVDVGFTVEPFCLLWSKTDSGNTIDTLAFVPASPWPPIQPLPFLPSILPVCQMGVIGCQVCDFYAGFEINRFEINNKGYVATIQFGGIAFSWAEEAKLAFGTNLATAESIRIWDGFLNVLLPEATGINFWVAFTVKFLPSIPFDIGKTKCVTFGQPEIPADNAAPAPLFSVDSFSVDFDFEIFIGFDKTAVQGNGTAEGEKLANDLAGANRGNLNSNGQDLWRDLQANSEDPCVIISVTRTQIAIPLVGRLVLGTGVGGFCNFSPIPETGVRCTPSGFFFNIDQRFSIVGGFAGILSTVLTSVADANNVSFPEDASGNSIGIFQNPDGENEAIVFRLEFPVASLFGITAAGTKPDVKPVVHFQYVKGSEIERRRQTILRTRTRVSLNAPFANWVNNCPLIKCTESSWENFYKDADEFRDKDTLLVETQICIGLLINPEQSPDKLLYYNRILTADTLDPKLRFDEAPPRNTSFIVPSKYAFGNRTDDNVVIVYLTLVNIDVVVISIQEITITLIISDGPPASAIDADDLRVALEAYDAIAEDLKAENGGAWEKPSGFNFPSLQSYLDYLPEPGGADIINEIEEALVFNSAAEATAASQLAVFIKIYSRIKLLFFDQVPRIGLMMENYINDSPNIWKVNAFFEVDLVAKAFGVELVALTFAVSAETSAFAFDTRSRRHLEAAEYERALVEDGLQGAAWGVDFSVSCGSSCGAFVEFFEKVGTAIWDGVKRIGQFFADDIANFAKQAADIVGDWGKRFIGAIVDFATSVFNDFKQVFEEGAVVALLDGGGTDAFDRSANRVVEAFADGKYTLGSIVAVGNAIATGAKVVVDFVVAGVTDVVNAIGTVFLNVVEAVGQAFLNLFGAGKPFDVLRIAGSDYMPTPSEIEMCDAEVAKDPVDVKEFKRKCWITDELGCGVRLPEVQSCKFELFNPVAVCNGFQLVAIGPVSGIYPRFDGRAFNPECRLKRAAKLAMANEFQGKMRVAAETIDTNFRSNFRGLSNFAGSERRSRRLREQTQVDSVDIPMFQAVKAGTTPGPVSPKGNYSGAQLQSSSTAAKMVRQLPFAAEIDLGVYQFPGNNPTQDGGQAFKTSMEKGAAGPFLQELKLDDPPFFAKQAIISPPSLRLQIEPETDVPGKLQFSCLDPRIADAWKMQLNSAAPADLRRERTRRLLSYPFDDSLIEIFLEIILVERIKAGEGITANVEMGEVVGEGGVADVFTGAKGLLGNEGAGAFLNPRRVMNRRRMQRLPISDMEVKATIVNAKASCDRLEWTFSVTATDITGTSTPVEVDAFIMFGDPVIEEASAEIQTRCDSTPIGVQALEDNTMLKLISGVNTFRPALNVDNCPSPFLFLSADTVEVKPGENCTTDYAISQRNWFLSSRAAECADDQETPVFTQRITLGGLTMDGIPATPRFELQDIQYELPNLRNATIATQVSDFYRGGRIPADECGICTDPQTSGIVFSRTQDFDCSEVGSNPIDITVLNNIGVSVTKSARAFVSDNFPTNMITKAHTVFLNKFGSLAQGDRVTVDDIDDGSWDNCGIRTRVVGPTPIYQCGDDGPQTTRLKIVDVNDNGNFQDETVTVDDSRRLAIGDNRFLTIVRRETEGLVAQKLFNDFVYFECNELAVYLRLKGESNFFRLEYPPELLPNFPGFNGDFNWVIPPYNEFDPESVLFHQALCGGVPLKQRGQSACVAELKAEVLCINGLRQPRQTCYRANLITTDECPFNDEKAVPTRQGKGFSPRDGCA